MSGEFWRIRDWFPDLDERAHERLRIYQIELIRWTKKINLISPSTIEEADRIHFADSILGGREILKDISNKGPELEIWDVGSGNGFPGVVIAILDPSRGVICVDSDERKVAFLRQLGARLELENLGARLQRVEEIPAEAMGLATSRGFAPLEKALAITQKATAFGGNYYNFKGEGVKLELLAAAKVAGSTWKTEMLFEYTLPAPENPEGKSALRYITKSTRI